MQLKSIQPKPKKCRVCGNSFLPWNSLQIVCTPKCAIEKAKKNTSKKVKQENKAERAVLRDNVENWGKKLQTEVNKIVRLIDKDLPCLARGNKPNQTHAGHIFARGGNQTIRYNLHNIHRQSAQSNHFQNDDGLLREGLINEYGQDYMDFIANLRRTPRLEYNQLELKDIALKASKIVLALKKADLTYSLKNRILMRNKINMELKIYYSEYCVFEI